MMLWLKKNWPVLLTGIFTLCFLVYLYACEPKTQSLVNGRTPVSRQELQLELDQFIALAKLRMLDLDKQDALRSIFLQNALILVQGQPFNPVGIITAMAALYGVTQGGQNVTNAVKIARKKRKENNGTT